MKSCQRSVNFWQDRVDYKYLNTQFMGTKCSSYHAGFKYIFGFSLCVGLDLIQKQKDAVAHQILA